MKPKKIKLQLVKFKNAKTRCSLHGIQKLVQGTKYGTTFCTKCFEDIKEFICEIIIKRKRDEKK